MYGPAAYRTRQQAGVVRRIKVKIAPDGSTTPSIDITDRFGFTEVDTNIIGIPTFGTGSEMAEHRKLITQSVQIKLANEDGWWNGVKDGNFAENVTPWTSSNALGYGAEYASNGIAEEAHGYWKANDPGQPHGIGYRLTDYVALSGDRPFAVSALDVWFPANYNPDAANGKLKVLYLASDGSTWNTATINYAGSTNITQISGNDFYTTDTYVQIVFTEVETTFVYLYQYAGKGNSSNTDVMAVTEIDPTGTFSTPRIDITSWSNRVINFRDCIASTSDGWHDPTEVIFGTYVITDVDRDIGTVTLHLESLDTLLKNASAEKLKQGLQWFRGRPVGQLVRHLLMQGFSSTTVNGWASNIPSGPITLDLSDTTARAASSFGPAATWKDVGSGSETVYSFADIDPAYVIEAVYWHDANSKLYLGMSPYHDTSLNAKIYEFDPTTFTLTDRTGVSYAGYNVWGIWYSSTNSKLVAAFGNDAPSDTGRTCTMKVATATVGGSFSEVESISNVAPCDFCYRDGTFATTPTPNARGIGHVWSGYYCGENLTIPFAQYVRSDHGIPPLTGGVLEAPLANIDTEGSVEAGSDYGNYFEASEAYRTFCDYPDPGAFNVKFSLGQGRCIDYVDDRLCFFTYSGGTYVLKYYTVQYDAVNILQTWTDSTKQPTAICFDYDESHIFHYGVNWDDSESATLTIADRYYYKIRVSDGTALVSGSSAYLGTTIAMARRDNASSNGYVACNLWRDTPTTYDGKIYGFKYVLSYYASAMGLVADLPIASALPLTGLTNNGGDRVYFVDSASGLTYYYDDSTNTISPANTVGGPAIDGEHWLATHKLAIDYNATVASEVVYGASRPGPHKNCLEVPDAGRYELFKVSNNINFNIPLADFSDLNCDEALDNLAAPIRYVRGFDAAGSYHFRVRPTSAVSPAYQIVDAPDGTEYPEPDGAQAGHILNVVAALKVNSGYKRIANYVAIKSSILAQGKTTGQGTFQERPEGVETFQSDLVANQGDSYAHRIILECTRHGMPVAHNNSTYPQALFRGYVYESEIQTELAQAESAASTSIHVVDTGAEGLSIEPGDYIIVGDDAIQRIDDDYGDVTVTANYVTLNLESGIGRDYDEGTRVIIYKKATMEATDGEYGVTTLEDALADASGTGQTVYVNSADKISVGTVIQVADERMLVEAIEEDSSNSRWTLTCFRGSHRSPTSAHSAGDVVKAFFAFSAVDTQYYVFGTGVNLGIYPPTDASTEAATAQHKTFFVGDRIMIEAPGLELAESKSVATAEDFGSQRKYSNGRRREYSGPELSDNRFMNHVMANEVAKAVLASVKGPHPPVTASVPYMFHIFAPGDRVPVVSSRYFKQATSYTVECEVMNVSLTPPTAMNPAGQTIWELRPVSEYDW